MAKLGAMGPRRSGCARPRRARAPRTRRVVPAGGADHDVHPLPDAVRHVARRRARHGEARPRRRPHRGRRGRRPGRTPRRARGRPRRDRPAYLGAHSPGRTDHGHLDRLAHAKMLQPNEARGLHRGLPRGRPATVLAERLQRALAPPSAPSTPRPTRSSGPPSSPTSRPTSPSPWPSGWAAPREVADRIVEHLDVADVCRAPESAGPVSST